MSRTSITLRLLPAAALTPNTLVAALALAFGSLSMGAMANPAGGVAIVGQATMVSNGSQLLVTTQNGAGTSHSAINWQSFSIPSGSTTYFQQPSASSTVINRVVTNTPSLIFGTLGSNGNLVLVNQAGIAVGLGAVVDTAGFTASALRMSDADALAGRLRFGDASASTAGVSVQGSILARSGDVVLIGSSVDTGKDALIQAPNGSTILAAGQQIEITGRGLEGISLLVQAPTDSAVNLGTLKGDAVGIFAGTLRHSGMIQATAASVVGGKVVLKATELLVVDGVVRANALGDKGGVVHATARSVVLKDTALIDVSSTNGGGEVLVGGGWHGEDARISNALQTIVAAGAQIKADATGNGDGGEVVVWADGLTRFSGAVSARGGALGGDGGRVEVSGKQALDFLGSVDLTAAQGRFGLLLLDPATITIGTTAAVDGSTGDVSGNILSTDYSGINSQITAAQVTAILNSTNLSLAATGNIDVNAAIAKTTGGASTLTLNSSAGNITISAPISSTSNQLLVNLTATSGNITTTAGISSNGGSVAMAAGGNINVKDVNTTPLAGNGGNISFISTGGGYTKLGVGGGNIDARGASGATADITVASSGIFGMESGYTIYANDLSITAVGGITNSVSGAVAIQAARVRAINSGSGEIKLQHTGSNGIQIHDLGGGTTPGINNSVSGGLVDVSSTFGMLSVGSSVLSNAGNIIFSADKMDIGSNVSSGGSTTGTVTLKPWNNGTVISLGVVGDTTNSTLELSATELQNVTSGILKIGASGYTGGIALNGAIAPSNVGTLSLINGGSISQSAGATITIGKLNADGGTGVSLTEANVVGTLAGRASTGNFSFTNAGNLVVGTVDINSGVVYLGTGSMLLTSTSGSLSLTQAVTGTSSAVTLTGPAGISQSGAGDISAGTLTVNNGAGGVTLNGANQLSNLTIAGTGALISVNNNKTTYSLNVGTVSDLTLTGTGVMNVSSWGSAANVSLSSDGGIVATNMTATGTLALTTSNSAISASGTVVATGATTISAGSGNVTLTTVSNNFGTLSVSGGTVAVTDTNNLTVTAASGTSVALVAGGAGTLSVNGNVTASTGAITMTGYTVSLNGAGVSSTNSTVDITSGMGPINISAGSYVSGTAITLTSSTTTLSASTLKPGGIGGIGTLQVNGNLTMTSGSTIAMDVASVSSYDTVTVTGVLNAATTGETVSVADLSGGVTTGALSGAIVTAASITGSPFAFSGPANWTMVPTATTLSVIAVASPATTATTATATTNALPGVTVAEFVAQFEAALQAQQDSADDPATAKDALVLEGEQC